MPRRRNPIAVALRKRHSATTKAMRDRRLRRVRDRERRDQADREQEDRP